MIPHTPEPGNLKHLCNDEERLLVAYMKQDIELYIKGCDVCQANKINTHPLKPAMMLITPEHFLPFQTISMDFITKLQKSGKYDTILTVTDHDCSKAAIFIPCQETITAEGVVALYCTMYSNDLEYRRRLSQIEIQGSYQNSPKDYAND